MACNWLMMTSSEWEFGSHHHHRSHYTSGGVYKAASLGLLTDKMKKNKPKAEQETPQPPAVRFKNITCEFQANIQQSFLLPSLDW